MGRVNDSMVISLRTTDKADWAITKQGGRSAESILKNDLRLKGLCVANPLSLFGFGSCQGS
jgi:hypothetical protein